MTTNSAVSTGSGRPAPRGAKSLPIGDPDELRAALTRLDERERRVVELRYGLSGERRHLFPHIGRVLGVSAERARQLEARAIRKLAPDQGSKRKRRTGRLQTSWRHRNGFLRPWTLVLLRLAPCHGYELNERLRRAAFPELDYRFLRALEDEGLVRSSWAPGGAAGPDRRVYRLTSKGTKQLRKDAEALRQTAETLGAFFEYYDQVLAQLDRTRKNRPTNTPDQNPR